MTSPPTLFQPPPADGNLTDRQTLALNLVRNTPGGTTSEHVGALLHHANGKHEAHVVCEWCADTGQQTLTALRRRGLVRKRQTGMWQTTTPAPAAPVENDNDIPY